MEDAKLDYGGIAPAPVMDIPGHVLDDLERMNDEASLLALGLDDIGKSPLSGVVEEVQGVKAAAGHWGQSFLRRAHIFT